jgi:hypothetical protein
MKGSDGCLMQTCSPPAKSNASYIHSEIRMQVAVRSTLVRRITNSTEVNWEKKFFVKRNYPQDITVFTQQREMKARQCGHYYTDKRLLHLDKQLQRLLWKRGVLPFLAC